MPQTPLGFNTRTPSGALGPNSADAYGNLLTSSGGTKSALNLSAAAIIKASPGRVARVIIVSGGSTSGAFTLNDCATTGAAAAANEFFSCPEGTATGTSFLVDWPCLVGIVLSAVPGGGSPVIAVSYD
jgi:hypothetical protein